MIFDIRTPEAAANSVYPLTEMTAHEFINEYVLESNRDFEEFWDRNEARIDNIDITDLKIIGFHVVSSLDDCAEIKANGLWNLQRVLTEDTMLKRVLEQHGLTFDIPNCKMYYNGQTWDIEYEKYKGRYDLTDEEELIEWISHRIYYDYCVNGFLCCDDVTTYGTDIEKRPEFILKLVNMFPDLEEMEDWWKETGVPYEVVFYALPEQVMREFFGLPEEDDDMPRYWYKLSDEQLIKKKLLSLAVEGMYGELDKQYLYIKDDLCLSPEQILACNRLNLT